MKTILLFCLFCLSAHAQFRVHGVAKDASTQRALPFASVTADTGVFAIADVDGKFLLESSVPIQRFVVSYVGFAAQTIRFEDSRKYYVAMLLPASQTLAPVNVAPDEKALHIIRRVIRDKPQNDPQKRRNHFAFKAYNKLVITANPDSIDGRIDSVFKGSGRRRKFVKIDSSDYKFKQVIARQHLFQTEKVSQFQFADGKLKETVLGTKMSGFKHPIYEILAFNLQSYSVYEDHYELFETQYRSPISADSFADYRFQLLDSTALQGRKTWMVYFKNKKKRKAAGLEGVLYIDSQNYAIAKAVMRIRGVLDISGTHEFEYHQEQQLWMPSAKNFKIVKGKNNDDIRILGETLPFDSDDNSTANGSRPRVASDFAYVWSESTYSDLQFDNAAGIKNPSIHIEVRDDAENKPDAFWNRYRKDSLDARSRKTYFALDSIVNRSRLDKKLLLGRKILNGYVALGPVDLDLRYLLSYNNYEGFRLGMGGRTNERFSRRYRIDGYGAYGTKDGAFKYSLGFATRVHQFSSSWIGVSYTDDVREIGKTSFAVEKRVFKIYDPRPINVSTFYQHKTWRTYFETRLIPKTESIWQVAYSQIEPKFFYAYNQNGRLYENYNMATAQAAVQWNPFSDYMQTPNGRLEVDKRFPKFTFQVTRSLPKVLDNDFDFAKFDFRTEYEKKYLNGQKTALLFEAGLANGSVPLTHLYSTSPNNLDKDKLLQRITIAGKNAFETMYFNEFFSSRYAMFQFKHAFKRLAIVRKVKPEFVLVSRAVIGHLGQPEQHVGFDYKTLEKGYFESGIEVNQIYSALGFVAFYRYGPYQLPRFEDNLAIKLSLVLKLGF